MKIRTAADATRTRPDGKIATDIYKQYHFVRSAWYVLGYFLSVGAEHQEKFLKQRFAEFELM